MSSLLSHLSRHQSKQKARTPILSFILIHASSPRFSVSTQPQPHSLLRTPYSPFLPNSHSLPLHLLLPSPLPSPFLSSHSHSLSLTHSSELAASSLSSLSVLPPFRLQKFLHTRLVIHQSSRSTNRFPAFLPPPLHLRSPLSSLSLSFSPRPCVW